MTDTHHTDRVQSDNRTHGFVAGATDPTDAGETPFVPTRECDARSNGACDDEVPSAPTDGECLVAALRGVFSR